MTTSREFQPAWLLHSRPFRDSSLIVDFLTRDSGRVSAVARGVRRAGSVTRGLLQAFTPLQVVLSGRHELKTLSAVEMLAPAAVLRGERLFSALYVNELLVRLVQGHETDAAIFAIYENTLHALHHAADDLEPILRCFEMDLLDALGYGLVFHADAEEGKDIDPDTFYHYVAESGFVRVPLQTGRPDDHDSYYHGAALLCIAERRFTDESTRRLAKRLLRGILNAHLGGKPLASRELFRRPR